MHSLNVYINMQKPKQLTPEFTQSLPSHIKKTKKRITVSAVNFLPRLNLTVARLNGLVSDVDS